MDDNDSKGVGAIHKQFLSFNNSLLFLSEGRGVGIEGKTCSQNSMIGFPLRSLCGVVDTELEWEEDSSVGEVISAILVTPTH